MNDVPLIQKTDINSINTSIIAIKKQLKQINEAVGLIDTSGGGASVYVKKSDVVNVVEADNLNPVTSNAVYEAIESNPEGAPLGTVIALETTEVPAGYLPCDGTQFDINQYPALYALLGTNRTPYRYDKSRLGDYESITISTNSASPTVMQFDGFITIQSATIDLQLRVLDNPALGTTPNIYTVYSNTNLNWATGTFPLRKGDRFYIAVGTVANSAVRYYKHYLCIKATSGLEETQQDYVLEALSTQINNAQSYFTTETPTGGFWIDGKPIYKKVLTGLYWESGTWTSTSNSIFQALNADVIVSAIFSTPTRTNATVQLDKNTSNVYSLLGSATATSGNNGTCILKYTKTTD